MIKIISCMHVAVGNLTRYCDSKFQSLAEHGKKET